jgi:hypothetical protein
MLMIAFFLWNFSLIEKAGKGAQRLYGPGEREGGNFPIVGCHKVKKIKKRLAYTLSPLLFIKCNAHNTHNNPLPMFFFLVSSPQKKLRKAT